MVDVERRRASSSSELLGGQVWRKQGGAPAARQHRASINVVVIDDDEEEEEEEEEEEREQQQQQEKDEHTAHRTGQAQEQEGDEEDDDCQIIRPPSEESSSSDCEVIDGERKQWEAAAFRRRFGKPAPSKSSRVGSHQKQAPCQEQTEKQQQEQQRRKQKQNQQRHQQRQEHQQQQQQRYFATDLLAESVSTSTSGEGRTRAADIPSSSSHNLEQEVQSRRRGAAGDGAKVKPEVEGPSLCTSKPAARAGSTSVKPEPSHKRKSLFDFFRKDTESATFPVTPSSSHKDVDADASLRAAPTVVRESTLMAADPIFRETIKGSVEYQKANEAEWARRQQELEKQAQEAQRLRKKRRAEADRRLEMENRQRQRLESMRKDQMKELRTTGIKEQIREQVIRELERKAAGCADLATLLRRLGVQVEGGHYCSPQQINAAYRRAVLQFHPDRAAGKNDPRLEVEAEETFKLISRMKATLQPVFSGIHTTVR